MVLLDRCLTLQDLIQVARYHETVDFSAPYRERVLASRQVVEDKIAAGEVIYGTTTGFGSLVSQVIPAEDAETLQRNIILTHSTSVGEPLEEEAVRAIMLIALQSFGIGVSGVRLCLLELYRDMLNAGVCPRVPANGSVGYLTLEAHIATVAIGEGQAFYQGELLTGREALQKAGLSPIILSYKEGLSLTNGIISVTALSALAIYDLLNCVKTADVIAALSVEALRGLPKAYQEKIMSVRPQPEQAETAQILLSLLEGSEILESCKDSHVQDALSLRCIPQAHGAVKKTIRDAAAAIERDLNACGDNPLFFADGSVLSNGNPDASYEGLEMDSCCMAATYLAKMSERRNTRFIDANLSGLPAYLVKKPGLNSGLMIPQYTQAGLLNQMRILSTPSCIDNVTTSGNQEDYVTMGFNSCQKARKEAEYLEYVLAIELLSGFQAQQFLDPDLKRGKGTTRLLSLLQDKIPVMEKDMYLYPYIEELRNLIHQGSIASII